MSASLDWSDSSGSSSGKVKLSTDDGSCVNAPTGVVGNAFKVWRASRDSIVLFDSGLGVNRSGPIEGSVPVYILRGKHPESIITLEDLSELRAAYDIPSCVSLAAPSDLEMPDWFYPGWTIMYECFFKMGARFPLPRLVLEACDYYSIAPSQLVPNAWRTLMAIQVFSELRGVHFSFSEVLLAYSLEMHRFDKVRYQLKASRPLVLSSKDSPKNWSRKYFFVSHNALGVPRGSIIPGSWEACTCLKNVPSILSKDSSKKIRWFLSFDEEERQFSTILTKANLRSSSLWSHIPADCSMSKPSKPLCPPFLGKKAHSEFGLIRGVAENLLLPDDRNILEGMGDEVVATALFDQSFLAMQKAAFLKEKTLAMAVELKELKVEKANWEKEIKVVKKAHDEANQIIEKLKFTKLDDARRAAADCQALQERVKQLEDQVIDVSCDTEIITRGLMAEEFLKIKPPQTWDVTRYLAEFEEWKKGNPDWVAQFERRLEEQDTELAANFAGMGTDGF